MRIKQGNPLMKLNRQAHTFAIRRSAFAPPLMAVLSFAILASAHGQTIYQVTEFFDDLGSNLTSQIEGTDHNLYGTLNDGGDKWEGVVFKLSKDGSGYTVLHNFAGYRGSEDGSWPQGVVEGSDSALYGTTQVGVIPKTAADDLSCQTFAPDSTASAQSRAKSPSSRTGSGSKDHSRFQMTATNATIMPTIGEPKAPMRQQALIGSEKKVLLLRPGLSACIQNSRKNTKKPGAISRDHQPRLVRGRAKKRRGIVCGAGLRSTLDSCVCTSPIAPRRCDETTNRVAGGQSNKPNDPNGRCPTRIVNQTLNATADTNAIQPPTLSQRQATTNAMAKAIA